MPDCYGNPVRPEDSSQTSVFCCCIKLTLQLLRWMVNTLPSLMRLILIIELPGGGTCSIMKCPAIASILVVYVGTYDLAKGGLTLQLTDQTVLCQRLARSDQLSLRLTMRSLKAKRSRRYLQINQVASNSSLTRTQAGEILTCIFRTVFHVGDNISKCKYESGYSLSIDGSVIFILCMKNYLKR